MKQYILNIITLTICLVMCSCSDSSNDTDNFKNFVDSTKFGIIHILVCDENGSDLLNPNDSKCILNEKLFDTNSYSYKIQINTLNKANKLESNNTWLCPITKLGNKYSISYVFWGIASEKSTYLIFQWKDDYKTDQFVLHTFYKNNQIYAEIDGVPANRIDSEKFTFTIKK